MEVPEGLAVAGSEATQLMCKLNKSLYGLKQAPRCWNKKFLEILSQFDLKCSQADQCIFVRQVNEETVYLALFVDDGLVAAETKITLNYITGKFREAFKIKIGDSSCFVGMRIERNRENKTLAIHQSAHIEKILEKFGMKDAKPVCVPIDPHITLYPVEGSDEPLSIVPYRKAIGSLVFLSVVSRSDIAFAVSSVSKLLNKHSVEHWRAVKRIFAYLKGTKDYRLEYKSGGSEQDLVGFSDADYANDVETRRSTTGYIFCMANGPI